MYIICTCIILFIVNCIVINVYNMYMYNIIIVNCIVINTYNMYMYNIIHCQLYSDQYI